MKRKLHYFVVSALLSCAVQLPAQSEGKATRIPHTPAKKQLLEKVATAERRVTTCGTDTILYPYLKERSFSAPKDSFFIDAMIGNVRTASQAYALSTSVNVLGIQFWGHAYSLLPNKPKTVAIKAYLYSVDVSNKPTTALDSATVSITQEENFYEAIFTAPHSINTNFAVAVKCVPNDSVAIIINNAGAPGHTPDYSESLAWRRYGSGTWNPTVDFFGQDAEYMIFPIVNYSVSSAFTASSDTICQGKTIAFTNTSPSAQLLSNRMFNLHAFDAFWGFAKSDSTSTWNYGDSLSWNYSLNGSHTYVTAGTYNTRLSSELLGYYTSCSDTASATVLVHPVYNTTASASICKGNSYIFGTKTLTTAGTYTEKFSSSSDCDSTVVLTLKVDSVDLTVTVTPGTLTSNTTGASYQWIDCNNANAVISGETNQSFHPIADGSYAVVVTNGACKDTSACIPYIGTGISANTAPFHVTAFPNPLHDRLTILCKGLIPDQIIMRNVLGETVREIRPATAETILETGDLASTLYFVQVTYKGYSKTLKVAKK